MGEKSVRGQHDFRPTSHLQQSPCTLHPAIQPGRNGAVPSPVEMSWSSKWWTSPTTLLLPAGPCWNYSLFSSALVGEKGGWINKDERAWCGSVFANGGPAVCSSGAARVIEAGWVSWSTANRELQAGTSSSQQKPDEKPGGKLIHRNIRLTSPCPPPAPSSVSLWSQVKHGGFRNSVDNLFLDTVYVYILHVSRT